MPLSAENHMAALVVPTPSGFDLIVVQDRTGGTGLVRFPLSKDGTVGKSKTLALGYSPAILPIVHALRSLRELFAELLAELFAELLAGSARTLS